MKIYGLLAGVNDYTLNVGKLHGCLNDVDAYNDHLKAAFPSDMLALEVLKDSEATRPNIIKLFRTHLSKATKDDVVLFQYAGHGARWKAAAQFREFYPDGFDEGLVCYDSRREAGNFDLADKELAVLVHEVARNGAHVAVILDCCHSGSATRSADDVVQLTKRMTHTVNSERPLESYVDGYYSQLLSRGERLLSPPSKHILLAACEREKPAFEGHDRRGIFSNTLLATLNKCNNDINYADLFLRIRATVRRVAFMQTPQFEVFQGFNSNSGFLNRAISAVPRRLTVYFENEAWNVDYGAINGLSSTPDHPSSFLIFDESRPSEPIGSAKPATVSLAKSQLKLDGFKPNELERYVAELASLPTASLSIDLLGNSQVVKTVKAFQLAAEEHRGIVLIEDEVPCCDFKIVAEVDRLLFQRETGELIQGVKGVSAESIRYLFDKIIKPVAAWQHGIELDNRSNRADKTQVPFELELLDAQFNGQQHGDDIRVSVGKDQRIKCRLRAKNLSTQKLHLVLVHFSDQMEINVLYNNEITPTDKWFTITLNEQAEFKLGLKASDGPRVVHRFKLFVSNEKVDDFLIHQEAMRIGEIVEPTTGRSLFLDETHTTEPIDWFSKIITVELVSSSNSVSSSNAILASGQIKINGHPSFKANVSLSCGRSGARNISGDSDFYKGLERQGYELINFSLARGELATSLELSDIQNGQSLRETPLELELSIPLNKNEYIVPVVFDGEHLLPVGDTQKDVDGRTRIQIGNIPESANKQRSVFSALKMYFFKTALQEKNVNQLHRVDFLPKGRVGMSTEGISGKVRNAKRVLLVLHGILGDSRSIVECLHPQRTGEENRIVQNFDLVLAYDYENLNTSISDTARLLETHLLSVGIGADDGKELVILAHSAGGLLARAFIENGNGKSCVDHLVMCGTPNAGSPLGKVALVRKVIMFASALSLNGFNPLMAACPAVLPAILSAVVISKELTKTLEDLASNSDFIRNLNASPDPKVRYTMLAGDISQLANSEGMLNRLIRKLDGWNLFHYLFNGAPNDIVVSTASAQDISGTRTPAPEAIEVGCHHMDYFSSAKVFAELFDNSKLPHINE